MSEYRKFNNPVSVKSLSVEEEIHINITKLAFKRLCLLLNTFQTL